MNLKIAIGAKDNPHISSITERAQASGITLETVDVSEAQLFLPALVGQEKSILECYLKGSKVLSFKEPVMNDLQWNDFMDGYVRNQETDWYARVFASPVTVSNPGNLSMDLGVTINPRAIILNAGVENKGGTVRIGRATHLGSDLLLNLGGANLSVGAFTMLSANVSVHGMRHTLSHISNFCILKGPFSFFGNVSDEVKDIKIDNDVWIGEGVTLLPGVQIGDGAVVGAASVVTKDIEPYAIYAGNPAKLIRYRFDPDKIAFLRESRWWNLPFSRLKEIQAQFKKDIRDLPLSELKKCF